MIRNKQRINKVPQLKTRKLTQASQKGIISSSNLFSANEIKLFLYLSNITLGYIKLIKYN